MDKVPDVISERNITPPIGHEDNLTSLLNDFAFITQLLNQTAAHMQTFLERLKVRVESEYLQLTIAERDRVSSAAYRYQYNRRELLYSNILGHELSLLPTLAIIEFIGHFESNGPHPW